VAVAVSDELLAAVAVMVQVLEVVGAVKRPLVLIVPQEADQVTAWLAENCFVAMACSAIVDGVMLSCAGSVIVAVVEAVWPLPSVAVAVMVQEPVVAGAVNRPVLPPIDPHEAFHVAAAVAENWSVAFSATDGFTGAMENALVPNPDSATVCGLLLAESVKLRVAVRVPAATGLNTIVAVQLEDAARLEPQVLLEIAKSAALVPEIAMLLTAIELEPLFVKVADFGAPVFPTATLNQLILDGLAVALPVAVVPVPESATVCGLLLAESVKLSVAVRAPVAAGLKEMAAMQLADAARLAPHVLLEIVKSAALLPVIAMLLTVIAAGPLFVNVADFGAPVCPSDTLTQLILDGLAETLPVAAVPAAVSVSYPSAEWGVPLRSASITVT
jgi:hypothetical protein